MQNSTTEIRVHRQQRCAAALQQVQANTLAQLGSNPLKPLLRATADPTAPSGASEKWVYCRKKNLYILVCCPQTGKEQGHGDGGFPVHQELLVLSLSALPFSQSLRPGYGFKVHISAILGISSPMLLKYHERGFLHQSPLLCSHSAESNCELMLNTGGWHSFHVGDIYVSLVPEAQGPSTQLPMGPHNPEAACLLLLEADKL